MGMRRIDVDEEVYAELERHVQGFEQPNDVLRRLLLTEAVSREPDAPASRGDAVGRLLPLIEAGMVQDGDELEHRKVRKGMTFKATVGSKGTVITNRGSHTSPSPALAELVGTQIDGWANWTHVPSGKTLRQLRTEQVAAGDLSMGSNRAQT